MVDEHNPAVLYFESGTLKMSWTDIKQTMRRSSTSLSGQEA